MIQAHTETPPAIIRPAPQGPVVIRREQNADLVNRITNESDVLPFIARHGHEIDWSPAVRGCVILSNGEDACMVLEQSAARDWQVTTIFAKTCRGRRAVETGLAMRAWMMPQYADMIFGSIPNSYRHAMWFYAQMGGVRVDQVESGGEVYVAQDNETLFVLRGIQ